MNFLKNSQRSYLLLGQLLSILVTFSVISCDCSKDKGLEENIFGNIIMHVPTDPLIGNLKTAEISFMLADSTTIAPLENFTLQATLQEKGGSGGQISYKDSTGTLQKTDKVDIPLKNLSTAEHLTAANPSLKVPFTFIITSPSTTGLTAEFKLLNKAGEPVNTGPVNWKKGNKAVGLFLSRTSSDKIKGDNKTISLKIENKETQTIEKGQLKLKIIRTQGNTASIQGATQVGSTSVYTIDLPSVTATSSLPYDLTIVPKDDQQTTFSIQLQYEDISIGNAVTASWEKGLVIEVEHDRKTNDVKVFVTNTGTETAKDVKLTYGTKTSNAKIGETANNQKVLKDLKPREKREVSDLGKLDFGKGNNGEDNMAAACEFGISCASSCPINPVTTVIEKKVFTRIDIVLSLSVTYDMDKGEVSYVIENAGKDTASGLKLKYENTSTDERGKLATVGTKQAGTIVLGDLASGKKFENILAVDLKDAGVASFNFELQYDNKPMAELVREFQNKPINLFLEVIDPLLNNGESYILYGANHQVKLKINQVPGSRNINLNDLQIAIQEESHNQATISQKVDGASIDKLIGADLSKDIILYINTVPQAKEAKFKLQLKYKNEEIGDPVLVEWREYQIFIKDSGLLVGDQEGNFQIFSTVPIELHALTVTLESDEGTSFQLYGTEDRNNFGTSATLSKVAKYDTLEKICTTPIKFKINQRNDKEKSNLKIVIRHKETVIAKKQVDWVEEGISLQITVRPLNYADSPGTATINVKNTSNRKVDLRKVTVNFSNTADVPFTLGTFSGASIERTLADILGAKELGSQIVMSINLRINTPLEDKIATGLTLSLLDDKPKPEVLDKVYFIYYTANVNNSGIDIHSTEPKGILAITKQIEKHKDNPGYLAYVLNNLENAVSLSSKLLDKYAEIKNSDSGFESAINILSTSICDNIKQCKKLAGATQTAILGLNKDEAAILAWSNQLSFKVNSVEESIHKSLEKAESINDIQEITYLLIEKEYDGDKELVQQSVKWLYEYYKAKIEQIEAFLTKYGINNFDPADEDLSSIKQLKELHNKMIDELPNIKITVQQALDVGFKRFNDAIIKEQQTLEPTKVDRDKQADIDKLYSLLLARRNALQQWKDLVSHDKELVGDPDAIQVSIAECYQRLAKINRAFARHVYSKKQTGNLTKIAELSVAIARDTFEITQITKNESTNKDAIEACKDAIDAWEDFERSRGITVFPNKPNLILGSDNDLRALPTVLQNLNSNLKSLKTDEEKQKKSSNKKKNIFGRFNRDPKKSPKTE